MSTQYFINVGQPDAWEQWGIQVETPHVASSGAPMTIHAYPDGFHGYIEGIDDPDERRPITTWAEWKRRLRAHAPDGIYGNNGVGVITVEEFIERVEASHARCPVDDIEIRGHHYTLHEYIDPDGYRMMSGPWE